jgi:hypothetical protein
MLAPYGVIVLIIGIWLIRRIKRKRLEGEIQSLQAEHQGRIQRLASNHKKEIESLKETHRRRLDDLEARYQREFEDIRLAKANSLRSIE